jgi:hypothetical protein
VRREILNSLMINFLRIHLTEHIIFSLSAASEYLPLQIVYLPLSLNLENFYVQEPFFLSHVNA